MVPKELLQLGAVFFRLDIHELTYRSQTNKKRSYFHRRYCRQLSYPPFAPFQGGH